MTKKWTTDIDDIVAIERGLVDAIVMTSNRGESLGELPRLLQDAANERRRRAVEAIKPVVASAQETNLAEWKRGWGFERPPLHLIAEAQTKLDEYRIELRGLGYDFDEARTEHSELSAVGAIQTVLDDLLRRLWDAANGNVVHGIAVAADANGRIELAVTYRS